MGVSEEDEEGNVFDALAATDRRPQDASPIITSRSIMVGERSNVDDSYHSQDSVANLVNSQNKTVNFEETSTTTSSSQRRRSLLNQSTSSRDQAFSAAQRTRERSEAETLAHPVADAGLNAFGCVFIEVWVMSDDGTKLTRPEGGHWMDPAFAQSLPDESLIEQAWALDKEARDCPPGAGLAGTLAEEAGLGGVKVHWRQIKSLLDDPFVQRGSGKRMEKLFELGVGIVAAVPFQFQEQRGLVLYYARSTAKTELLRAPSNERYMKASADLIGANICIRKARQESANFRKSMFKEAVRKCKKELLGKDSKSGFASMILNEEEMKKLKLLERDHAQDEDGLHLPRVDRFCVKIGKMVVKFGKKAVKRTKNSVKKWRGAKLHGPPRQSLTDAWYSFLGAFLTMLTILKISRSIGDSSTYAFDGGWYASTLCIIYALTPAPVGQPRQIFAAHLWNMLVALAIRQIPSNEAEFMDWSTASYGLPLIWKQALSVGLGIAGQAYIGILHPPATGLSNTFVVRDKFGWGTMASVMITDCVVVAISMMILNLEEKKQWPLYWLGLGWEGSGGTIGKMKAQGRSVRRSVKQTQNSIKRRAGSSSKREKMNGDEAV